MSCRSNIICRECADIKDEIGEVASNMLLTTSWTPLKPERGNTDMYDEKDTVVVEYEEFHSEGFKHFTFYIQTLSL